ncbi:MAG: mechanosensitive ion channel family protein [Myxococcota bacterium]
MRLLVVAFFALASALFLPRGAFGQSLPPVPTCDNPRDAVDSLFAWQEPNVEVSDFDKATKCFEADGKDLDALAALARHAKRVFDDQGKFIKMENISDEPGYVDPTTKRAEVLVDEAFPQVQIIKRGDKWLWSAAGLEWMDDYYRRQYSSRDEFVEQLPAPLQKPFLGVAIWQYIALIILVVLGYVARVMIVAVITPRLRAFGKRIGNEWPTRVVDVVAKPGGTFLTAIILDVGYPALGLPVRLSNALDNTVTVLITFSVVWAAYGAVDLLTIYFEDRAEKTESRLDDQLVPLVRKTLKVIVVTLGVVMILDNLDFDVTTLVANISIGTLALGLAAKDTIANLFGSISIFVDNPFQIGDWIHAEGTHGTVEEVGFRSTRIRTFYNSLVVMPNAKLADSKIDNYGQRQFRRCFITLGLTYDTTPEQMQAYCEGCRAIILANEYTRKDAFEVHMSGFGDSSLEVMVYFFFECDTWSVELRERHNVFLEFMRLARDLGVGFAFPTQSVHIEGMAPAGEREIPAAPDVAELAAIVEAYGPQGDRARPGGPSVTSGFFPVAGNARGAEDG